MFFEFFNQQLFGTGAISFWGSLPELGFDQGAAAVLSGKNRKSTSPAPEQVDFFTNLANRFHMVTVALIQQSTPALANIIQKSALQTFCPGPARTACTDLAGLWVIPEIGGKDHFSCSPRPTQVNCVVLLHTGKQTCKQINFQCRHWKASYGIPELK